jgi:DNA-binding LacI/PurR family transcriptional regulator
MENLPSLAVYGFVLLVLQRCKGIVKRGWRTVTGVSQTANVPSVSTTVLPARLKDVAVLAGVSVKTVSNVVNDYPFVRPTTRAKVQEAIDALGYRPNMTARNLRSGRSGVIALAVPEVNAPYFAELAHHVVRAAMDRGWTVLVDETGQTNDRALRDRERSAASGIRGQLIDGVILSPLALDEADLARYGSVPLVLLGERLGSHLADHVAIDNRAAAMAATRHLLEIGRRRIAVIGTQPPPYGHTARQRLQGYRAALRSAKIPYDRTLVVPALDWGRAEGLAGIHDLLALPQPPDAVFCLNDLLALGAIRGLSQAGVRVPTDVAVVGFDDIEESRFSVPTLTTVAPDKAAIAAEAVARLARRLDHGLTAEPEEVLVDFTLEVRESTGR